MHQQRHVLCWANALAVLISAPALAQELTNLSADPLQGAPGQSVTITVEVRGKSQPAFQCGLSIAFGDGETRDIRISEKDTPLKLTRSYGRPGSYTISVQGKLMVRGINSVFPCTGSSKVVSIGICVHRGGACPDCVMVPETSCVAANNLLSRSVLRGHGRPKLDNRPGTISGYLDIANRGEPS